MRMTVVRAMVRKDLMEVGANRMAVLPLVLVPLLICLVMPLGFTIAALVFGNADPASLGLGSNDLAMIDRLMAVSGVPDRLTALEERILWLGLNQIFLPLMLLVPVMVTVVLGANALAGEKERHTLETLLSTPVENREFLASKLAGMVIPGIVAGLLSFVLHAGGSNLASLALRGILVVDSPVWIPVLALTVPALCFLAGVVTLMTGVRARSYMEAQQWASLVVLPLVMVVVGQVAGLVVLNPLVLVLASLVVLGVSIALLAWVAPRFTRERIIQVC